MAEVVTDGRCVSCHFISPLFLQVAFPLEFSIRKINALPIKKKKKWILVSVQHKHMTMLKRESFAGFFAIFSWREDSRKPYGCTQKLHSFVCECLKHAQTSQSGTGTYKDRPGTIATRHTGFCTVYRVNGDMTI